MNPIFSYMYQQKYPVVLSWTLLLLIMIVVTIILTYIYGLWGLSISLLLWLIIILISGLNEHCQTLYYSIENFDKQYKSKPRVQSDSKVIISLTTIPSRINYIEYTLKSLLRQKYKVDEIVLWIPYKTLKGKTYEIPDNLSSLKHITIKRCELDYGPGTKLLHSLRVEEPDTKIIVVDDDVIYKSNLVDKLVHASNAMPDAAFTTVGLYMTKEDDFAKFNDLVTTRYQRVDRVMGMTGFLVKPKFFYDDNMDKEGNVFDYSKAPEEAKWVDDIWFSCHLLKRKVPVYRLPMGLFNFPVEILQFSSKESPQILHVDFNNNTNNYKKTYEYFFKNKKKKKKIKLKE